jgi:DHA3 family multidrug efflux protein-like MFS transporter
MRRVAIVGGNRIPFARSGGTYAKASNQDMLTAAIDGLVARFGLGRNPVRTMLLLVVVMGLLGMGFVARESIWLYVVGIWLYMAIFPAVESAEQTVIQRVVPLERQGRVFGFAMAVESAAAPVTAFIVAPLAEFWIIPWSRSEPGREALQPWLGAGETRGIALVLVVAGLIMAVVALLAFLTPAYRSLVETYAKSAPVDAEGQETPAAALNPITGTETTGVAVTSGDGS